jgi:hypothetical protein
MDAVGENEKPLGGYDGSENVSDGGNHQLLEALSRQETPQDSARPLEREFAGPRQPCATTPTRPLTVLSVGAASVHADLCILSPEGVEG